MRKPALPILAALLCLTAAQAPAHAGEDNVCKLLSLEEAAGLLGQPVTQAQRQGPRQDGASGGRIDYCTYRSARAAVVLSVVEFASGPAASRELTTHLVEDQMDAASSQVSEAQGLGERSYYGVSDNGAMVAFLQGNKVVGLAVGGKFAPSETALIATARAVADKL